MGGHGYHPAGPVGHPCPPCTHTLRNAASWPITARFQVISHKVSQNGIVSPKNVNKACHSPYIQNGAQKSPLEILRFPLLLAFSPKELMVLFLTSGHVLCQNDEVSLDVHTMLSRERVADTPTMLTQQAASVNIAPHLLSAVFSSNHDLLGN